LRLQINEPGSYSYFDDQCPTDSDIASSTSDSESENEQNDEPQPHETSEPFPNAGTPVDAGTKYLEDEEHP
jgi:hypothetical protein